MPIKIEHRVGVKAPASVIWEIIADLPAWSEWNPLYPQASGVIRFGERLKLTETAPGQPPRTLEPAILDWAPDEALHWRRPLAGGLGWAVRYLEIDVLSDTGCAFSNGELFGGLVGPMVARRTRRQLRRAFTALGEAVRDRAEARWRERQGGAT
jgi:hypothetical protein